MMTPILTTKLHIPSSSSNVIQRARLFETLDNGLEHKLILISASAGFGKTTLVASWLETKQHPVAWLSLDENDSDVSRFLLYLISALQTVDPSIGQGILPVLTSPQSPSMDLILTQLVNDLAQIPDDFMLVLDDYHMIDSPEIDEAINFLLNHSSPQIHIIITTREDPNLPLARLRVRGQLNEIRAADLRFTTDEASEFLNSMMGLDLSSNDFVALEQRTEGWIAGLQLAAISIQGQDDKAQFLAEFTGSHHYIMDYLIEEVLSQQTAEVRQFLLYTSILDRLNGDLCDAVTGQTGSHTTLEQLEKRNLFVIALDHSRDWFRYHHLFADVLQVRLNREAPEVLATIHRHAAKWYVANGYVPEAIRHAFLAEDYPLVARFLELVWSDVDLLSMAGRKWFKWAKQLPEDFVLTQPIMCLGFAWGLVNHGDIQGGEYYLQHAENFVNRSLTEGVAHDEPEWEMLSTAMLSAHAYIAMAKKQFDQAMQYAQESLARSTNPDHVSHRQASALLGIASWASGNLEAAESALENHLFSGNFLESGIISHLGDLRIELGKLQDAQQIYQDGLARIDEFSFVGKEAIYRGFAIFLLELGDLDSFKMYLDMSKSLGEQMAVPSWKGRYDATEARYYVMIGDYDTALERLEDAEPHYLPTPIKALKPIPARKARIWLLQGHLDKVKRWAVEQDIVAKALHYSKEYEHITLAQLYIAQYRQSKQENLHEQANELLAQLLSAAETGSRLRSVIEIQLLRAQLVAVSGDLEIALSIFDKALDLAAPQGYVALFVIAGDDIKSLLQRSKHPYIRHLLAAFPDVQEIPSHSQTGLFELLSERELEVLTLIADGLSNREISKRLFIALDTVKGHNRLIYQKLQVRRRTEAVARARELGLI